MSDNTKRWIDLVVKVLLLIVTTVAGWQGVAALNGVHAEAKAQTALMRGHP